MSARTVDAEPYAAIRLAGRTGIASSCLGFTLLGASQALYGPAIPQFLERFAISQGEAGLALSTHFAGALAGVLLVNRWLGHLCNRTLMGGCYGLMAIGCMLFAWAPQWELALLGALLIGLAFGGLDLGLNYLFSIGFGKRSVAMVNLLNAHFGVGAVLGPMLIAIVQPSNYPLVFVCLSIALLVPALLIGSLARYSAPDSHASMPQQRSGAGVVIIGFLLIYILHVAIETGVGAWEPTHLETIGYSAGFAAGATAGFWMALTLGRFIAVWVSLWISPERMVIGCSAGMALCLALATIDSLAVPAYLGTGLFIAPIFASGLAWMEKLMGDVKSLVAYVLAASMIGGVAFPPLLGYLMESRGAIAGPLFMSVLALACVLVAWGLSLQRGRP